MQVLQEKEFGMVEVPLPPVTAPWQKSFLSGESGACVQIRGTQQQVWVRDSKDPAGPALRFTRESWLVFLTGMQRGEFDCPTRLTV